jgi:hypothetical protein
MGSWVNHPAKPGAYSQAHTSATLAAQAASNATVSVSWTRSQEVWWIGVVLMTGNIRRF